MLSPTAHQLSQCSLSLVQVGAGHRDGWGLGLSSRAVWLRSHTGLKHGDEVPGTSRCHRGIQWVCGGFSPSPRGREVAAGTPGREVEPSGREHEEFPRKGPLAHLEGKAGPGAPGGHCWLR